MLSIRENLLEILEMKCCAHFVFKASKKFDGTSEWPLCKHQGIIAPSLKIFNPSTNLA